MPAKTDKKDAIKLYNSLLAQAGINGPLTRAEIECKPRSACDADLPVQEFLRCALHAQPVRRARIVAFLDQHCRAHRGMARSDDAALGNEQAGRHSNVLVGQHLRLQI